MTAIELVQPESCFVCGTANPLGMHATFRESDEGSRAEFTCTEHHEGWPGVVHGGVLTSLLDEAMAYALWFSKFRAVTARLETRFRATVAGGDPLVITARVLGQRRSIVTAEGEIRRPDGARVAEAQGTFMLADVDYPMP